MQDITYIEEKIKENILIIENRDEVIKIKLFVNKVKSVSILCVYCIHYQTLIWLKAIGNAGLTSPTTTETLNSVILNEDLTVDIRVSGVHAYR